MLTETFNPLDEASTYSIRYQLTVANCTEAIRTLLQNEGMSSNLLVANSPGDAVSVGEYTVYPLCDTRRFTQFYISEVVMDNTIAAHPSKGMYPGMVNVTITDTCGLSFYNLLLDLMHNKLQTSISSAVFLLTTMFIGHHQDGSTYTAETAHTTLQLINISDSNSGASNVSTLPLEFIETVGSEPTATSSMRPLYYLQGISSVSTQGYSDTVGGMIASLETRLNEAYISAYMAYWSSTSGAPKTGKLVQYMILLPDEWAAFKLDLAAKSSYDSDGYLAPQSTFSSPVKYEGFALSKPNQSKTETYSQLNIEDNSNIAAAILKILKSSSQFNSLLSEQSIKNGTGVSVRIVPQLSSDKSSIVVHFDIFPEYYPKMSSDITTQKLSIPESNILYYNYLFTGTNTNVIDFKVGYQNGGLSALFRSDAIATAASSAIRNGQQIDKVVANGIKQELKQVDNIEVNMPADPIIPLRSPQSKSNNAGIHNVDLSVDKLKQATAGKQSMERALAILNFVSYLDATAVIRGNPLLLRRMHDKQSNGGMPPHPQLIANPAFPKVSKEATQKLLKTAKDLYINTYYLPRLKSSSKASYELEAGPSPLTMGLYAKIDVRFPSADFNGVSPEGMPMFTNKLVFQGLFKVIQMTSTINGSDFTHTLEMIPYMVENYQIEETNEQ